TAMFNNAVTIVDSGLYGIYRDYFADQLAYGASGSGLTDYYRTPTSPTGPYKTYFMPRHEASGAEPKADPSTDTVKLILDNVSCSGGTQVRMAANLFTRTQVARKLVSLAEAGCSVRVAQDGRDDGGSSVSDAVNDILAGKLTKRVECREGDASDLKGLHSKYL